MGTCKLKLFWDSILVIQLWGKRNTYSLLVGVKIGYTAMEISGEASQSLRVELPHDPAIALLGYTHRILYPSNEIVAHSCLLPPYSQQWDNDTIIDVHQQMNGK